MTRPAAACMLCGSTTTPLAVVPQLVIVSWDVPVGTVTACTDIAGCEARRQLQADEELQ